MVIMSSSQRCCDLVSCSHSGARLRSVSLNAEGQSAFPACVGSTAGFSDVDGGVRTAVLFMGKSECHMLVSLAEEADGNRP